MRRVGFQFRQLWQAQVGVRYRRFEKWFIRNCVEKSRVFEVLWAGIVTLRSYGFSSFARRFFRWLHGERRYRASATSVYQAWQRQFEPGEGALRQQAAESVQWTVKPSFAVVTVVNAPDLPALQMTAQSVLTQTYACWTWYVVDDSEDEATGRYLAAQAGQNVQLILIHGAPDQGIAANANLALERVSADFVVMLDHGDTLATWALYAVASVIRKSSDVDIIYSDFDSLDGQGVRMNPLFKPDWSPEAMLGYNLLDHLGAFRRSWLERVGLLNPDLEGAQHWDLYLRISEQARHIEHIPQVLYHRRIKPNPADAERAVRRAEQTAVTRHLERLGLGDPQVSHSAAYPVSKEQPRITWKPQRQRRISIIIPSRDLADVLGRCLESLFGLTTYPDYQVILVDTGSVEPATTALYERYAANPRFKLVHFTERFNFSKACNFGARQADGELLLFLNNDTEVQHGDWLDLMAQWFDLKGVGIVGPKLLYPGGIIQHAGVIVGLRMLAGHIFSREPEYSESIYGGDGWYRNLLAVTGACVLISRAVFDAVGGFEERYRLLFSDVQLCLQAHAAGYRIVYTPHVRLIHHESLTHRRTFPRTDFELAFHQWRPWLEKGDPYFNPNLTYNSSILQLKRDVEKTPVQKCKTRLARLPHKEIITEDDL